MKASRPWMSDEYDELPTMSEESSSHEPHSRRLENLLLENKYVMMKATDKMKLNVYTNRE